MPMIANIVTPRRLHTLRWYARRPRLWRHFFRVLGEKRRGVAVDETSLAATRQAARAWADARAVSVGEALHAVTGSAQLASLAQECAGEVADGQKLQRACPVKMGSGADYDLLYTLAERTACRRVIETGVAFGWSSFALLHSVAKRNGHVISTDMPYPLRDNDRFVGCVVPARLHRHWTLLRAPDRDALPAALRRLAPIDLCHYDSDKTESGRRWAYPRLWRALRPGGLFVTDDVQDNFGFAEFCAQMNRTPLIVRIPEHGSCKFGGILQKPGN